MDPRIPQLEMRIERLERTIRLMTAISRSTAPAVDTGNCQTNQGQIDPLSFQDRMPTLLNYGFSSSLPVGGDKAVFFLGGDRSQGVVIATGHQVYRFRGLQLGQVVMHDMWGHSLLMSETGASLIGNLSIAGNLTATGSIIQGLGGPDQVGLGTHHHPGGSAPVPGT
jgi:phage gp45-like